MASSTTIYVNTFDTRIQPFLQVDQTMGYEVQGTVLIGILGSPACATTALGGADPMAYLKQVYPHYAVDWAENNAGAYTPRLYRGTWAGTGMAGQVPQRSDSEANEFTTALQQEEVLISDLKSVAQCVSPDPSNLLAWGTDIRNLLIVACTEVESQMKGVLKANGATPIKSNFCTLDYVKLLGPLRLDEYSLRLARYRDYPAIEPFKGWDRNSPTKSLLWYDAYNATKHDRELNFREAKLQHAVSAIGALTVLLAAQYGPESTRIYDEPFLTFVARPEWRHKDRSYAPPPGGQWTPVPYPF